MYVSDQVSSTNNVIASGYYRHSSRYKEINLLPNERRYVASSRTAEQAEEYTSTFNSETSRLVEEGKMVVVNGGSTIRVSALNSHRGYTTKSGSIRSNLPGKRELAAAYKDGKAVVSSISVAYESTRPYRDGILYSERGNGTLTGEVITRMTPEGEVQIIGQNLKCSCYSYRENYNCAHIGLATQDVPKIFQAHSKPQPPELPGVGEAGQAAIRASRSNAYGIANDPETGRNYLKISNPRRGTPFNASVIVNPLSAANERLDTEDIIRMNSLWSVDESQLTDDDRQFIYRYYNDANNLERRNRSGAGIRVSPLSNRAYLSALPDTDVQVPVEVSFPNGNYYSGDRVTGRVLFGAGSTAEDPIIRSRSLKCSCADYRRNYECEHINKTEERYLKAYLMPAEDLANNRLLADEVEEVDESIVPVASHNVASQFSELLNRESNISRYTNRGVSREEAIASIEAAERAERERLAAEEERVARMAAAYKDYRELRLAAWQTTDTPLAENIDEFKAEVEDLRRRKRRGEKIIEAKTSNVTDGICAPGEGTRSFGIELEFDIKSGVDRGTALRKIATELHEAGLTNSPHQQRYHSANGSWDSWSFEQDCTVAGEIVSPILKDTPEHWAQLSKVIEIVERNGGKASTRAGSHVNISSGSLAMSTAKHAELTRIMKENESTMFRLASDPGRGSHRGNQWCRPNLDVASNDIDDKRVGHSRGTGGTHGMMVNFDASLRVDDLSKARIEYRLWDSTLDVGVIQQQVAISAALTDLAEREVMNNKGYKARPSDSPAETDPDMKAAKLFDRLFRTTEQRKEATKLFAITNPV